MLSSFVFFEFWHTHTAKRPAQVLQHACCAARPKYVVHGAKLGAKSAKEFQLFHWVIFREFLKILRLTIIGSNRTGDDCAPLPPHPPPTHTKHERWFKNQLQNMLVFD